MGVRANIDIAGGATTYVFIRDRVKQDDIDDRQEQEYYQSQVHVM